MRASEAKGLSDARKKVLLFTRWHQELGGHLFARILVRRISLRENSVGNVGADVSAGFGA